MILGVVALMVAQVTAPQIVELSEPGADSIVVQVLVNLPDLGGKELAAMRVIAEVLPAGTEEYSVNTLRTYSSLTGQRVRCTLMPDHFRIQVVVPQGQLPLAVSLADSLLRRASLPEEAIKNAIERQPFRFRSYWTEALDPFGGTYARLRRDDIVSLYKSTFVPGKVTIGIGGGFAAGEAIQAFGTRFTGWTAPRLRPLRISGPPKPLERRVGAVTTVELAAPTLSPSDGAFPAKVLALTALGSGKGSSAFRTWRDAKGWTYRTEAVLWPSPQGLRPRLIAAMKSATIDPEAMRKVMLEDVASWTFETRDRALGMAEAMLIHGIPYNPLYLSRDIPLTQTIEDRTFLSSYWKMKTGAEWDAHRLLKAMQEVDTEGLQAAAKGMLEESYVRVIAGTP